MPLRVGIVATSLDDASRSQRLARVAADRLADRDVETVLLDLRQPGTRQRLGDELLAVSHLIFAVPVYNFGVNAAAKEVIEIVPGDALNDKTVGFLCAAGGSRSYMAVLPFANALMLDFRCWIVPRFVYATGADFDGDVPVEEVRARIERLLDDLLSR